MGILPGPRRQLRAFANRVPAGSSRSKVGAGDTAAKVAACLLVQRPAVGRVWINR
jgi:hypothetical protein